MTNNLIDFYNHILKHNNISVLLYFPQIYINDSSSNYNFETNDVQLFYLSDSESDNIDNN